MKSKYLILISVLFIFYCLSFAGGSHFIKTNTLDISAERDVKYAVTKGLNWLISKQDSNGSWCNDPAITGLVLSGFLRVRSSENIQNTVMKRGFDFIIGSQELGDGFSFSW